MNKGNQTKRNLFFNLITLFVNVGVGLFYTPYLVRSLGIVAYGIVPLALIINQYINVITGSLTGSLTRFYSVAIQQNKTAEATKYLSSSFMAITVIVLLLSPVFVMLVAQIDRVFNIPYKYLDQARVLFVFTILSFIISLYSSLLNVTLYALNRLDLMNSIKIMRTLLKVLLVVILFESISENISYIGYASFIAELGVLLISVLYFTRTTAKNVKVSFRYFEKSALISVLAMTIWVVIHQIGDTGLYRIDNIMVNKFWSTRESGILGAVTEFGTYVMLITSVISTLFGPLILIAYGNNDHNRVKELALRNSLFVGLLTGVMVGILCGFSRPILSLWLGEEFTDYNKWFILKQVTLPFYAAAGVFAFVYRAWNKVAMPAIITLVIGLFNFFTSYLICKTSNGQEKYIFLILLAASFFIIIQSFGLNAFSFKKVYPEIPKLKLLGIFLKILVTLVFSAFLSFCYTHLINVESTLQLLLGLTCISVIVIVSGYFGLLNQSQKKLVLNYFLAVTHKSRIH